METRRKITQYRERLDKTLASPDLTNVEVLRSIVKNQLIHSSEQNGEGCKDKLIVNRTTEVSNFLDMLRSTSVNENMASKTSDALYADWKLKQDNEEFRVMYREGPKGSPFHTLLVEGYVDGPIDVCLCISWETFLYKKWWPQSSVPSFKVLSSECLQKVRIGEQISLVRVKVSWPLSTREAIVHYFLFEYLQADLVVVLLNTVSDLQNIDETVHGFTNESIPEANDVVRIDVVGGFALQKVNSERSYFRTIANMDVKLDFFPPSLINFISRQLIGNGFRLYQKAVSSMLNHDEEFSKALADPLYAHIHDTLYSTGKSKKILEEELKEDANILPCEDITESKQDENDVEDQKDENNYYADHCVTTTITGSSRSYCEIEEEDNGEIKHFEEDCEDEVNLSEKEIPKRCNINSKRNVHISAEVKQALGTLEKVISVVRDRGFNSQTSFSLGFTNIKSSYDKKNTVVVDSKQPEVDQICLKNEVNILASSNGIMQDTSKNAPKQHISGMNSSRVTGTTINSKEVNYNRIAPSFPEENLAIQANEASQVTIHSSAIGADEVPKMGERTKSNKQMKITNNGIHDVPPDTSRKSLSRQKKRRYFCFCTNLGGVKSTNG